MLTASEESSIAPINDSSASMALGGTRPALGAVLLRSVSNWVISTQRSHVLLVGHKNNNVGISLWLTPSKNILSNPCDIVMPGRLAPASQHIIQSNYFATTSTLMVASTPSKRVAVTLAVPSSLMCSTM